MSKKENQKRKILFLLEYLKQNTDENHSVTMEQILSFLDANGIQAERKSIYDDINTLIDSGYEIVKERHSKNTYYSLIEREFELSQIKILVDAVNSFKFTSENNSREIVSKLGKLVSRYQASALNRQTYVADKVKTTNKIIFYNIDQIHKAIGENSQISFNYFEWNNQKKKVYKYNNKKYIVSPYRLILTDGNYYLIAVEEDKVKHFRVDKMENVELTDTIRQGKEYFDEKNISEYSSGVFGMFGSEFTYVDLQFSNELANVVVDRFGQGITITKIDDNNFKITVKIVPSSQFFGWIFALGKDAKILYPPQVVDKYLQHIQQVQETYKNESSGY